MYGIFFETAGTVLYYCNDLILAELGAMAKGLSLWCWDYVLRKPFLCPFCQRHREKMEPAGDGKRKDLK